MMDGPAGGHSVLLSFNEAVDNTVTNIYFSLSAK